MRGKQSRAFPAESHVATIYDEIEHRNPQQDVWDDLMDEALEAIYHTGFVDIAHDLERGNTDTVLQDLAKEIMAEEDRPKSGGRGRKSSAARVEDLRDARTRVNALWTFKGSP